eukprot:CAMPEP_0177636478 /NCGR_PEP_ID=MMETSP0447-20121125/4462_1 /TAXON_ID=0 /ORGANISM="Stygamoeba regulata, Strain BSH-02190019" /LENGTH=657 /DNA_ID=CAMNT_0019138347 /DNA_START=43 /DNA_END=2017 /DNA_ORIENTATION=+
MGAFSKNNSYRPRPTHADVEAVPFLLQPLSADDSSNDAPAASSSAASLPPETVLITVPHQSTAKESAIEQVHVQPSVREVRHLTVDADAHTLAIPLPAETLSHGVFARVLGAAASTLFVDGVRLLEPFVGAEAALLATAMTEHTGEVIVHLSGPSQSQLRGVLLANGCSDTHLALLTAVDGDSDSSAVVSLPRAHIVSVTLVPDAADQRLRIPHTRTLLLRLGGGESELAPADESGQLQLAIELHYRLAQSALSWRAEYQALYEQRPTPSALHLRGEVHLHCELRWRQPYARVELTLQGPMHSASKRPQRVQHQQQGSGSMFTSGSKRGSGDWAGCVYSAPQLPDLYQFAAVDLRSAGLLSLRLVNVRIAAPDLEVVIRAQLWKSHARMRLSHPLLDAAQLGHDRGQTQQVFESLRVPNSTALGLGRNLPAGECHVHAYGLGGQPISRPCASAFQQVRSEDRFCYVSLQPAAGVGVRSEISTEFEGDEFRDHWRKILVDARNYQGSVSQLIIEFCAHRCAPYQLLTSNNEPYVSAVRSADLFFLELDIHEDSVYQTSLSVVYNTAGHHQGDELVELVVDSHDDNDEDADDGSDADRTSPHKKSKPKRSLPTSVAASSSSSSSGNRRTPRKRSTSKAAGTSKTASSSGFLSSWFGGSK